MKTYDKNAVAARFLLGGIGTGNISLDQNARLCDFELWNKPNKGFRSPYTFFAVRTEDPSGKVSAKALESQLAPPFDNSHGANAWDIGGLPRFKHSTMTGAYPFVNYTLTDDKMPVEAALEAFTPLIPLDVDDSSLPVASLKYSIKNTTDQKLTVSVAGSMANLCNMIGTDIWTKPLFEGKGRNTFVDNKKFKGLHFTRDGKKESSLDYFEMALTTTEDTNVTYLDNWNEEAWWDGIQDFWNDFIADGDLTMGRKLPGIGNALHTADIAMGSICIKKEIQPGETATFEFFLSWYQPNRVKGWQQNPPAASGTACCGPGCDCGDGPTIRNYYAKFGNALQSAEYFIDNYPRLEIQSRQFSDSMTKSTLPEYAIEAVLNNIVVIRSTTCFMVEDGTFFGWEGCFDGGGCCEGNCSHVWNYTQTLAYLFPSLERSMRETEFLYETNDEGRMNFRAANYLQGHGHTSMPPATDGQLGTVIRLYRDWKICGDDTFLKKMWPHAKLALEYAFTHWDKDGDGVMEAEQHNTYDIEFYGISSMLNSVFFAALKAGAEMATYLGDTAAAEKYTETRIKGAKKLDELTFNGEFYEQKLDNVNLYKYQYGKGCLSDQVFGQQLAHAAGLGHVMDPKNVKTAVHSIYKYNFIEDFSDFVNMQRQYALNDNSGLVLCNWPNGDRPEIPFVYSDEVWTGIEYQVASHLIYEGLVAEGLAIVKACRDRHDGIQRSPWNEVECGHHYARSLASYAVHLALTGFHCDAVNKKLKFAPVLNQDRFNAFFCCEAGWGVYYQEKQDDGSMKRWIETLYGDLSGYEIV